MALLTVKEDERHTVQASSLPFGQPAMDQKAALFRPSAAGAGLIAPSRNSWLGMNEGLQMQLRRVFFFPLPWSRAHFPNKALFHAKMKRVLEDNKRVF